MANPDRGPLDIKVKVADSSEGARVSAGSGTISEIAAEALQQAASGLTVKIENTESGDRILSTPLGSSKPR